MIVKTECLSGPKDAAGPSKLAFKTYKTGHRDFLPNYLGVVLKFVSISREHRCSVKKKAQNQIKFCLQRKSGFVKKML